MTASHHFILFFIAKGYAENWFHFSKKLLRESCIYERYPGMLFLSRAVTNPVYSWSALTLVRAREIDRKPTFISITIDNNRSIIFRHI